MSARILIQLVLLLVASGLLVMAQQQEANVGGGVQSAGILSRLGLKLPEIFSFDKFKEIYHKQYDSPVEESNRMKFYLPRAFQVLIEYTKYMTGSSPSYLALNHMSDWLPEEREKLFMPADPNDEDEANGHTDDEDKDELPVASLEEVERKLVEIKEQKSESPEFAQIAEQLEQASNKLKRRKRATGEEENLSVDQLLRDPAQIVEPPSPKLREIIPSNNPNYERPQVNQEQSLEPEENDGRLSEEMARKIGQSNSHLLSNIVSMVKHPFSSSSRRRSLGRDGPTQVLRDYRDSNCFPEVKDQGKCSSCYIFSIMSLFEYHYCLQTHKLVPFSEQYVLDCGQQTELGLEGCKSSPPESTWMFVQQYGLELGANYPYKAKAHTCPYEDPMRMHQKMGYIKTRKLVHVDLSKENRKKDIIDRKLETEGPLIIGLKVDRRFLDYGGAVDYPKPHWMPPKHAMVIVGHGIERGEEYWLIRNSMGKDWGLNGYYKLSKNVDPKVLQKISYVKATFDKNNEHDQEKLIEALGSRAQ